MNPWSLAKQRGTWWDGQGHGVGESNENPHALEDDEKLRKEMKEKLRREILELAERELKEGLAEIEQQLKQDHPQECQLAIEDQGHQLQVCVGQWSNSLKARVLSGQCLRSKNMILVCNMRGRG
jgi:ribosome-binding ATPase YchF (GTP1/OBG family)